VTVGCLPFWELAESATCGNLRRRVLLEERENAVTLFVQMRGTFPAVQRLDIRQNFRELTSRDRWMRRIVARQHQRGHRTTPHKFAVTAAVGVGVGLSLQPTVLNVFSGIVLLLDKLIKPGDVIEVGGTYGWVSSLDARYVLVETHDGTEFLIPNEDIITQQVLNWSHKSDRVRLKGPVRVPRDSDLDQVLALMLRWRAGRRASWPPQPPPPSSCPSARARSSWSCGSGSRTRRMASPTSRAKCSTKSGACSSSRASASPIRSGISACAPMLNGDGLARR
jgi:hypothetical protein